MTKITNKYGYQQSANVPVGQQGQQDKQEPNDSRKLRRLKLRQSVKLGRKDEVPHKVIREKGK